MRHVHAMLVLLTCCSMRLSAATTAPLTAPTTARVAESFRGWVNVADSDDATKLPRESYSTINFNGASVHGSDAWFFDRTTGQSLRYEAKSNTVFITRMHPGEIAQNFEGYGRQTFKAVSLDALRSDWQNVGATAQYAVDGKLDRYVVKYSEATQTYWFDPTTRRLAKVQGTNAGKVWTKYYRYNAPAVKSIYDLGVPTTAKIVDNRPTGELKELLARIDQRLDRGLGDYVAILTETPIDAGQLMPNVGSITLYAQEGTKWLSHRLLAGGRRVVLSRFSEEDGPLLPLPDGWPNPDIAKLIKPLAAATPNETYVVDGVNAWWCQYKSDPDGYREPFYDHGAKYSTNYGGGANARAWFFLNGLVWVGSDRLELMNAKTGIALERDEKRRGLICLLADNDHSAFEVWLDPARDDLLAEFIHLRDSGPATVKTKSHWKFEAFGQLPDGRWYPTRWTCTMSNISPAYNDTRTIVYHLQIDPAQRLDASWFTNPINRLKKK